MRRPADGTDSGYFALSGEDDLATPPRGTRTPLASTSNNDRTTVRVVVVLACLALIAWAFPSPLATGSGGRVPPPRERRVPGVLNVHIVPHTHDDVGWLKTVDQYYTGANASIQHAAVRHILTSVVDALLADPTKTFVYAEMAFFARWWREQTSARRTRVRTLVAERRLEFVNGGWCMHDEATAHVADMLEQTTRGHAFIAREFGTAALPRVGWQLDPFGHASTQATHLGSGVGFDAVFLGRASDGDIDARVRRRAMEFTWRGSDTLGAAADVKGMLLSKYGNYGPPPGHCYDQACEDPLWQDEPSLKDYNVPEMVARFERAAAEQAGWFQGADANEKGGRGGDVMFTMGTDFTYGAAGYWYDQLDRLVRNVNQRAGDRLRVFYSTPSAYLDAKLANPEMRWETKRGDFFPYGSYAHQYWTGYFTSRPTLKRFVRVAGQRLRAARALTVALAGSVAGSVAGSDATRAIDALADAVATAQHHDAVTGTSRQHVANDYAGRLSAGLAATDAAFVNLLDVATRDASARDDRDGARLGDATPFTLCPLLNVSSCAPTETAKPGSTLAMVAFNPSARARVERVRVPVSDEAAEGILRVVDARTNRTVPAAILPAPTPRAPLAGPATRQLAFVVELFPFSATTFFLESAARPNATERELGGDGELGGELGGERDGVAVHARVVAGVPASGRSSNKVGITSPSYSSPIDPNASTRFFRRRGWSGGRRRDVRAIPFARGRRRFFPERRVRVPSRGTTRGDVGSRSLERRHRRDVRGVRDARVVRRRVGASHDATVGRRGARRDRVDRRSRARGRARTRRVRDCRSVRRGSRHARRVGDGRERRRHADASARRTRGLDARRDGTRRGELLPVYLRRRGGGRDGGDARGGGSKPRRGFATRRRDRDDGASPGVARRRTGRRRGTQRDAVRMSPVRLRGAHREGDASPRRRRDERKSRRVSRAATRRGISDGVGLRAREGRRVVARATTRVRPVHPRRANANGNVAADEASDADADVGFPRNANLLSLEVWREGAECARGNCALVRVAHAFEGEGRPGWDATLSKPVTLDLSALFPGRVVARARQTTLAGQPTRGADSRGSRRAVVTLEPMEIKAVVVVFEDR